MGKVKIAPITRESIRKATEEAEKIASSPSAIIDARIGAMAGENTLCLSFRNGEGVTIPVRKIDELRNASRQQLQDIVISPMRDAISFPNIDVDIYAPGLLVDVFAPLIRAELSRRAGKKSSPRKAAAVRENGKKGGRPKKRVAAHR